MGSRVLVTAAVSIWLTAVSIGLGLVNHYAATPGREGSPVESWSSRGLVEIESGQPALIVFIHPLCPCTRATLEEVEHLVALCGDAVSTHIVCVVAEGLDDRWRESDLVERARSLEHVRFWVDDGGEEATRLGALTSGHVMLYDATGHLVMHGGITASRGHAGESRGAEAIVDLVRGLTTTEHRHGSFPVFGCPLTSEMCTIEREGT